MFNVLVNMSKYVKVCLAYKAQGNVPRYEGKFTVIIFHKL